MKVVFNFYEDGSNFKQMYNVEKINSEILKKIIKENEGNGDEKPYITYKGKVLDIENPILPNTKTREEELWENLKKEIITSNKGFFEVIDMMLNKNFLWLILNESYEENGNKYIPMVMEIYTEEMLVYKITSCSDGEIKGNWEISKIPSNILKLAEEEAEYDYYYWKNHWIEEISHDFYSDFYFEKIAMDKIVDDIKNIYATNNKQVAFNIAKKYLVETLMYNKAILKYISLNDSNRIYCKVIKNFGFVSSFSHMSEIFSREFMVLKNEGYIRKIDIDSNNYHICIRNPKYDNENGNEYKSPKSYLEIKIDY